MKKLKGTKRLSTKPPGATPKGTHLKKLKGSKPAPKRTHNPIDNLGDHAYPKKAKGVGPAKKLNVKRVVADITKSSRMKGY
jgi:hypothetical protein